MQLGLDDIAVGDFAAAFQVLTDHYETLGLIKSLLEYCISALREQQRIIRLCDSRVEAAARNFHSGLRH